MGQFSVMPLPKSCLRKPSSSKPRARVHWNDDVQVRSILPFSYQYPEHIYAQPDTTEPMRQVTSLPVIQLAGSKIQNVAKQRYYPGTDRTVRRFTVHPCVHWLGNKTLTKAMSLEDRQNHFRFFQSLMANRCVS